MEQKIKCSSGMAHIWAKINEFVNDNYPIHLIANECNLGITNIDFKITYIGACDIFKLFIESDREYLLFTPELSPTQYWRFKTINEQRLVELPMFDKKFTKAEVY